MEKANANNTLTQEGDDAKYPANAKNPSAQAVLSHIACYQLNGVVQAASGWQNSADH